MVRTSDNKTVSKLSVGDDELRAEIKSLRSRLRLIEERALEWASRTGAMAAEVDQLQKMVRSAHEACSEERMGCPWCEGEVGAEHEWHNPDCAWLKRDGCL
jgi:hypothetical protein